MSEINLENEIKDASDRIQTRQLEVETELTLLESKIKNYTKWAWGFVCTGILISILSIIFYLCKNDELGFELNLLGDFLSGSVGSIWALAGLFLVYVAFLGQKQQLLYQQMEIMYSQLEVKHTRLELKGQKQEMVEQNKTLKRQRFENTFFQLLKNHQEIVSDIDIVSKSRSTAYSPIARGRDCFRNFYDVFKRNFQTEPIQLEFINESYTKFYNKHQSDLGHYFRQLYYIILFIKESPEIKYEEKFKYTSLFRALLSSYELVFIFYNGLNKKGEKLKPLLEEFSILKNIDDELLLNKEHKSSYDELAFSSSEQREKILANKKITSN